MEQFAATPPSGTVVMELEGLVRTAIFKPAAALLAYLLQAAVDRIDAAYSPKPGEQHKGRESLEVQCLFGVFRLLRTYYYHPGRQAGHCPADEALGLEGGYTPALARLICLEGADEVAYEKAQRHLLETGGIPVDTRQIQRLVQRIGPAAQRWQGQRDLAPEPQEAAKAKSAILYVSADGTGVPMRKSELIGRKGKQPDGTSKSRQVYLGCVFTQHTRDPEGHPLRDYESTTYISCLGSIDEFAPLLRTEALRRGMACAARVVLLLDGAESLECMGRDYFPGDTQIVDFYHAMEHATLVLAALLGSKEHADFKTRRHQWAKALLRNGVGRLIEQIRSESQGKPQAQAVEKELGYFVRNLARMQYGTFRKQGLFIGSGVVEAGCKTVIGCRCKQAGMHWSVQGAQNILALRCLHASRRFSQFWQHRLKTLVPAA